MEFNSELSFLTTDMAFDLSITLISLGSMGSATATQKATENHIIIFAQVSISLLLSPLILLCYITFVI